MIKEKMFQGKGRLVVVADDMGKSISVNRAIAEAHDRGILRSASVMAGGDAFDDAVQTLLERERLSAGLHLTLCDGKAVLPHKQLPDITDINGNFIKDPFVAGLHYTRPGLRSQIEAEITAQFDRLEKSGIRLYHVDGHHHLHMHPMIFTILCRQASGRGIGWIRIPREPLSMVKAFRSPSRGSMPFIEWAVFGLLGMYNGRKAVRHGLRYAEQICGLARSGSVDEEFLVNVLPLVADSFTELYVHPDKGTESGRVELASLVALRVANMIKTLQMSPAGYKDLSPSGALNKEATAYKTVLRHSAHQR